MTRSKKGEEEVKQEQRGRGQSESYKTGQRKRQKELGGIRFYKETGIRNL